MTDNIFDFIGGHHGQWKILKMEPIVGETLKQTPYIQIVKSSIAKSNEGDWALKGLISNIRYTEKEEKEKLISIQADLGRPEATNAALIPIKKSEIWWNLAQDERRKIFEAQSNHTKTGLKYLPAIARKLYHCRDIGEPFDFITFFEYAPSDSEIFEELLYSLRTTEEWKYVEREVDIRLVKE